MGERGKTKQISNGGVVLFEHVKKNNIYYLHFI